MRFPPVDTNAPSVLVVDEGFIGSLHTAIGLRHAGLRVVLLGAVGGRSSYRGDGFEARTAPPPGHNAFADSVERAAAAFGCDIVYPTTEPSMLALHRRPLPLHPALTEFQRDAVADKRVASRLAAGAGLSVPPTIELASGEDVDAAASVLGLPMVVKTERGRGGDGTRIVTSCAEACAFLARARASARAVVAQRFVQGRTYLAGGLFRDGEPLRFYAGEKLRQQPDATGPAILIRSVDDQRLRDALLALMRALRWTGLASTDFIRDEAGAYLFLEVNPRPWGSIAAAQAAGVELHRPLAELLRGRSPTADLDCRAGVSTHVLPLYLLHRAYRRPLVAMRRLPADLSAEQGVPFRDPAMLRHVLYRLWRVKRNWRAL